MCVCVLPTCTWLLHQVSVPSKSHLENALDFWRIAVECHNSISMAPLPNVLTTSRAAMSLGSGVGSTPTCSATSSAFSNFDLLLSYVQCYLPPQFHLPES